MITGNARRLLLPLCLAALAMALTACGKKLTGNADIFIPEQPTAWEQFQYAQRVHQTILPSSDSKAREGQMEQVLKAYKRVYELFPDDRVATPRAMVVVGMLYARMPNRKAEALDMLGRVEKNYPDIEEVLVPALFDQARLYDQAARYDLAQPKYKEVFERWGASDDAKLKDYARRARERYNRVRVLE